MPLIVFDTSVAASLFALSIGLIFSGELVHESQQPLLGRALQFTGVGLNLVIVPTLYAFVISIGPGIEKWSERRLLFHVLSWGVFIISVVLSLSFLIWWRDVCEHAWGIVPSVSAIVLLAVVLLLSSLVSDEVDLKIAVKSIQAGVTRFKFLVSVNLFLVVVSIVLGVLAEVNWTNRSNSKVAVMEAIISLALFVTAVLNTHGLGGQIKYKRWAFFNPFMGGVKFVFLQFCSWLLFSVSVILGVLFIVSFYTVGIELFAGVTAISGVLCLGAEALMVLSLHFYDEEQYAVGAKEPRRGMGSVVRFARSMHMFATVVLCANIQYVPFMCLYPVFLLAGVPFGEALVHWWLSSVTISLYTLVYLFFKSMDGRTQDQSRSSVYLYSRWACLTAVQLIPLAAALLVQYTAATALYAWLAIAFLHIAYIQTTYTRHPEVSGAREVSRTGLLGALVCHLGSMVQQYFRGCILKEAELDPTKLYVFGFHPHGVLPVSLFWLNSCEEWRLLFPQVGFSILTASSLHLVPIMRDLLQWKGGREVSRNSCVQALRSRRNILVVPGGQTELMLCKAYDAVVKLTVRNQGFIKLAIQEGAHLVPVFSFGEHDVFDNVHLPLIQNWFLKKLGAALPFHPHNGRFLPIPRQERITVVVGKPIPVRQIAAPTADDVRDVLHAYLSELHRIFEAHKNAAYRQENRQLVFIDGHGERYVVPSDEKIEPDSE